MIKRLLASITLSFVVAAPALAVELRDATSQQILDELAYRLRTGGGGGGNGARAIYSCDSSTYLQISVVSPTGSEVTDSVYIGNAAHCTTQSQQLNANRSRISSTVVAAVCDSSTYLQRYSITPEGALGELQSRYIGNMANCMAQAESINSGN